MSDKQAIIDRLMNNLAEVITEDELKARIESGEELTHYIGFEISGYVHIGQGIMSALVIKDLQALGVKCTIWLADWHTAINKKLDGNPATAARIGKGYFTEAMKACLLSVGADPSMVEFRLASDYYQTHPEYLEMVVRLGEQLTLARLVRSISIMGREAGENVDVATLMYPMLQVADIFIQKIDIAHSSMDQRKAHVIMRDAASNFIPGRPKPIAMHHPLIDSLTGESKMSKSKPDSAVFIHDSAEDIQRKIQKAFCEEKNVEKNPILNWAKNLLFWNRSGEFVIEREEKFGGNVSFSSYEELQSAFVAGDVHPMDLKSAVAKEIIELLAPAREHFAREDVAAKKRELDDVVAK